MVKQTWSINHPQKNVTVLGNQNHLERIIYQHNYFIKSKKTKAEELRLIKCPTMYLCPLQYNITQNPDSRGQQGSN